MFHANHPRLVLIIKSMIQEKSGREQAEEVAAAVWCSLCGEAYSRLRRYDPKSGRFLGYLVWIARREIWRKRRAEQRRHRRECRVARSEATLDEPDRRLAMEEFLDTLTRREREYCMSGLMGLMNHPKLNGSVEASPTCKWQLRSRVLKKFETHFFAKK
jgi:DNA-directed RNA polymerase specialized sigma24 family protein